MSDWNSPQGPFDIAEVPDFVPRRLKPWLFILFVLIIQFSGGLYLAAASDMVGSTALMQEDILLAGYASLIGMAINFAVMFRIKFRFSTRTQLLACAVVLICATAICATTTCVPLMVGTCLVAGWFRMQGTLACNSTIQLWISPGRDMAVFFCYVFLIVDTVIQISGIMAIYTAFYMQWENMHWIIALSLCVLIVMVLIFVRPVRGPMFIPLLGIDWIGSLLWAAFMLCFAFVCVYGNFYDWWQASEICDATVIGLVCLCINLWRMSFLHHPYVSWRALTTPNLIKASAIYLVFYTVMATEHVFEQSYAANILGFDDTNLIDLNWYVVAGIIAGVAFTYYAFALHNWRYKTMGAIAFGLACMYLAWFYFNIDYGIEKEVLFIPLFLRGAASVIVTVVFLTSIVRSGLPFQVFPQSVCINGFTGAVMGATFGPAVVGELLRHTMAKNSALLGASLTASNASAAHIPLNQLYGMVQTQALIVSMKEIYGILLMVAIAAFALMCLSHINFHIPVKPMKAMARRPAVTSAIGTPRIARGTSASSSCMRMPAKSASAKAKPSAVATA